MENLKQANQKLESSWLKTRNYTMHARYSKIDSGDRPDLVVVHGVGVSSRNLIPTLECLAPYYSVYAPDLPGFGLSSKPRRILNVPELADALLEWLDSTGLDRPVLIADSFGCQIITDLVYRYPSKASCLVLIGPTVDSHARNLPVQALRWLRNNPLELPSQKYSATLDYRDCGRYRFVRTFMLSLKDRPEDKMPHLSQPTLIVRGEKDKIVSQQWAEELARLLPHGRLSIVKEAAHTVNYSHPVTLTEIIRSFIDASLPVQGQEEERNPTGEEREHIADEKAKKSASKGKAYQPPLPAAKYIAAFDSASSMLRTLSKFLHGQPAPLVGGGRFLEPVALGLDKLPTKTRENLYRFSGWSSALPQSAIHRVNSEEISRWAVEQYPTRQYPAVMIGSSNGALTHLCAALGIPWLPQTVLIPIRYGPEVHGQIHPDEPKQDLEWARETGQKLLEANPDLQLHHMHDQNQDRLMIQRMSYFRVKRLKLGEIYEQFLAENLAPGGIIYQIEDGTRWPVTRVDERHFFQHGAVGGATPQDYLQGSAAVEDFLRRYHSYRRSWDSPQPDSEMPEAEWGFEAALGQDIAAFASRQSFRVRRVSYSHAEVFSPLVADLYRWWYQRLGYPANRLLVESFMLLDPYLTLTSRSVPFWTVFNVKPSLEATRNYLATSPAFDEIFMTLFSHGVDSIGLASIEEWQAILNRASQRGEFLGVDQKAYPRDFATFVRYHLDMERKLGKKQSLPASLTLSQFEEFLNEQGGRYELNWH